MTKLTARYKFRKPFWWFTLILYLTMLVLNLDLIYVCVCVCYIERVCVPWEPQVPRILWWTLLDHVEAAHVWLHRLCSGVEGACWGCEGIPKWFHPNHWIWQCSPSPVHQFHCSQASWLLNLKTLLTIKHLWLATIINPSLLCLYFSPL